MQDASAYEGIVYPFSQAIKKTTGQGSLAFYQAAMQHYAERWKHNATAQSTGILILDRAHGRFEKFTQPL